MKTVSAGFNIQTNFSYDDDPNTDEQGIKALPSITIDLYSKQVVDEAQIRQLRTECIKTKGFYLEHQGDVLGITKEKALYYTATHQGNYENDVLKTVIKNSLGMISFLNNRIVLHGNLVSIHNIPCVIIAPSGYGKSTLSAALVHYQNAEILSDDSVYLENDGITVYSGYRHINLYKDSIESIYGFRHLDTGLEKHYIDYKLDDCKISYPISVIFILNCDTKELISVERNNTIDAMTSLLSNLRYRNTIYTEHFMNAIRILSQTISNVPVYTLSFIKDYSYLKDQTDYIAHNITYFADNRL